MDNKSKGRPMNPDYAKSEILIKSLIEKYSDWTPSKIRKEVNETWFRWLKTRNPNWTIKQINDEVKKYVPSQSKIRDMKKEKPSVKKSNLDNSWNLGLMRKPEFKSISGEFVFTIVDKLNKWLDDRGKVPLTGREVLWLNVLHFYKPIWEDAWKKRAQKRKADVQAEKLGYASEEDLITRSLYGWVRVYSELEKLCYLSGYPLYTSELDKKLLSGQHPVNIDKGEDILEISFSLSKGFSTTVFTKNAEAGEINYRYGIKLLPGILKEKSIQIDKK